MDINWQQVFDTIVNWATNTGVKIIIALLILFISFKVINRITRKIEKKAKKFDKTILKTLMYLLRLGLKCIITICMVGYLGIDTSGLTALIASLGVCFGLAVNGAVSNIAGGVLIIITRPFKLDDFIEAQGYSGTVEEINLVSTKLRTGDNKVIYVPNGALSSGSIVNYSEKELRRLDLTFSIGYANDFETAKKIILEVASKHGKVLTDPAPFVRVSSHSASSIDIVTRLWVNAGDYWDVNFYMLEEVKKAFDANNIEIPFNQLDVHVKQD